MALKGIDAGGRQKCVDLAVVPSDLVIMKATGGVSYVSDDYDRQYPQAKQLGKLRAVYHFANDDGRRSSAPAEADFLCRVRSGITIGRRCSSSILRRKRSRSAGLGARVFAAGAGTHRHQAAPVSYEE